MDKQSDTSNTLNTFELEIVRRRLLNSDFQILFQRVSNILCSSVAIHFWDLNSVQDFLISSDRRFSLCNSILSDLIGNKKCFLDRYNYAKQAIHLGIPLFYKCHMGFSCGVISLIKKDHFSIVLTVGPFYIEETIEIFCSRVFENLGKLSLHLQKKDKEEIKSFPKISLESVKEVLVWTQENFQSLWARLFEFDGELKSKHERKRRQDRKVKEVDVDVKQYFDKFDKVRMQMFMVAIRMKNKKLMRLILKGKGEELYTQRRDLQEIKFSVYTWVINILSIIFVNNSDEKPINKKGLLTFKEKIFTENKSLKVFIGNVIKVVFSSVDENFFVKDNKRERFNKLFSTIERKLIIDNSLSSVAESLQIEPSALSHWIKRNIGINYEELLDYIQVEKIAELLRDTDKNLSEIGDCVGIQYSSLVSEKFKRITGLNPTEYRICFQYRLKE